MGLSPEERRKIYEEEKARIEDEQRQSMAAVETSTGLEPNVAGLLCYLGIWISGIVFLVLERENRFVRFHALQSIIVFGALTIASALLAWIPFVGGFFGGAIWVLAFVLWIVLMVKAYQGDLFRIPAAGDLAEKLLVTSVTDKGEDKTEGEKEAERPVSGKPPPAMRAEAGKIGKRLEDRFTATRAGRITGSSFAIAWSFVLLIFFSFFSDYIAYYQPTTAGGVTTWVRYSLLTSGYYAWLPILTTTLILTIAGHIALIVYDRYWLRESILIFLNVLGIVTVSSLLSIFPFDFGVIPSTAIANALPVIVTIALIAVAVGIGIGTLVMFIKLIVNLAKQA
jgi:uncharacterized membrane protein